ncbi:Fc.00g031860.m01.CDS01 [Cosmosporella sp. VM-42]
MAPKTPISSSTPIFSTGIFSSNNNSSRPTTREGIDPLSGPPHLKDRKASFSRKSSLSGSRRRGSSFGNGPNAYVTDATAPPALPDYALAAAAKVIPRGDMGKPGDHSVQTPSSADGGFAMLTRTNTGGTAHMAATMPTHSAFAGMPGGGVGAGVGMFLPPTEVGVVHQQITELANKRISTLDYLRKAHEGRVYWFNTYLFDKPDLNRMPYFDPRKLGRKATNYLLLGLSLPTIVDLYSSTPLEFLRSLNTLLSEFDSFQQLHSDTSTSLARARLPNMFRRQGGKSRRSTSAADMHPLPDESAPVPAAGGPAPPIMNFAASETDLLPGEEYTHLLTPSLPFDPDYFETFATLCDVLIDCYSRFLTLVPSPRECSAPVAELFQKADSRVRKIIVQGVVKEFEDHSRSHIKSEVASIGKVVLGGLM